MVATTSNGGGGGTGAIGGGRRRRCPSFLGNLFFLLGDGSNTSLAWEDAVPTS